MYPPKLNNIINLFESLPEDERRETLVSYADNARKQEPREGEQFDLQDIRKDEECADTVGVYLHVDENGKAHIRMTLGPEVQTLTRAMTAILCKGLEGATPQEILDLPSDFVTRIIGAELVRVRSQTTYYVLTRIKGHLQGLPRSPAHGGGVISNRHGLALRRATGWPTVEISRARRVSEMERRLILHHVSRVTRSRFRLTFPPRNAAKQRAQKNLTHRLRSNRDRARLRI